MRTGKRGFLNGWCLAGLLACFAPDLGWAVTLPKLPSDLSKFDTTVYELPEHVFELIREANRCFVTVDSTVTSAKYQDYDSLKERAASVGKDMNSVLDGDWEVLLGSCSEPIARRVGDSPFLVVRPASGTRYALAADDSVDPLMQAVAQWLESKGMSRQGEGLVLAREGEESAGAFEARVGKAQAALDQQLSAGADLERVLTITRLPVRFASSTKAGLAAIVPLRMMSLTPTGFYGFGFSGVMDAAHSKFFAAGQGITFFVDDVEDLVMRSRIEAGATTLYAEVDVTIAAMALMMPRAHDMLVHDARIAGRATAPNSARLLPLPSVQVRALRLRLGDQILLMRQPYFAEKLLQRAKGPNAGGEAN